MTEVPQPRGNRIRLPEEIVVVVVDATALTDPSRKVMWEEVGHPTDIIFLHAMRRGCWLTRPCRVRATLSRSPGRIRVRSEAMDEDDAADDDEH